MQCTSPFWLRKYSIFVPCGKCIACRIGRSREWTVRLLGELTYWRHACFVTLTYDDLHCPLQLHKKDLQNFFKRLRKRANRRIKYYACGEYGDTYGRPHYHAIIFGVDVTEQDLLDKCWKLGYIKVGTVTKQSVAYVTDYVLKKWISKEERGEKCYQEAYQCCSRGIGLQFAIDNALQLQDNLGLTISGRHINLPKYYVEKLGIDKDMLRVISDQRGQETFSRLCKSLGVSNRSRHFSMLSAYMPSHKGGYLFGSKLDCYIRQSDVQRDINFKSKSRFKKGVF